MISRPRTVTTLALLALIAVGTAQAEAEQRYRVEGRDVFRIGTSDVRSEIAYRGTQRLTTERAGAGRRYVARVDYDRNDQGTTSHARASYEAVVDGDGQQRDGANRDPDYLTVLNQPFSVQLDPPTLRELARLRGPVPFDFPSPMTGATLHGSLRRLPDASMNGERVLGVAFEATGPLHGPLPDHPEMALAGTIGMKGTAYYTYAGALLLALDATLTIAGALDEKSHKDPVSIVYRRSIRAAGNDVRTARR